MVLVYREISSQVTLYRSFEINGYQPRVKFVLYLTLGFRSTPGCESVQMIDNSNASVLVKIDFIVIKLFPLLLCIGVLNIKVRPQAVPVANRGRFDSGENVKNDFFLNITALCRQCTTQ